MSSKLKAVERDPAKVVRSDIVKAGTGWCHVVHAGQILRIVDLCGNQSADMLLYNAEDPEERYSVNQTVVAQRSSLIELGTELCSNQGRVMMTVVADTCGMHDTLGSGCSAEGNTIRYTNRTRYMHSCRDVFVSKFLEQAGMDKRDQACNLNFFTRVKLDGEGTLEFIDGISGPGKYVDLEAAMEVLVVLSNCAQLNNPCNDYNPTPLQLQVWDAPRKEV